MYSDTITLFNRYDSADGELWYPTVLHGVDVNIDRSIVVQRFGEQSADNAILHIKYQIQDGIKTIGGKHYLPPKEWARQTNDMLPNSITFAAGEQFDFFYLGEWGNGGYIKDDDYALGSDLGFYSYMNRSYDHVYAITSASEFSVIPHFELSAK